MKVVYRSDAVRDYINAIDWYEEQVPGLGEVFRRALLRAEERIATFPESAPEVTDGYRVCLVPRFPYQVVFRVADDVVRVYAVMHCARDTTDLHGGTDDE